MKRVDVGKYIVIDPEICRGQMTFKDTRVPVDTVLTFLAKGYSVDVLLHSWPELSRPAIEEAVSLASQSLQARYALYVSAAAATSQHDYPVIERKEVDKRRAFYRSLQSSGLVKRIKRLPAIGPSQRALIQVQGSPVSRTIIEQRR